MHSAICINEKDQTNERMYLIPFGEKITITGRSVFCSTNVYVKEYPKSKSGRKCSYEEKLFAPLTGIDGVEVLKNQLQTV